MLSGTAVSFAAVSLQGCGVSGDAGAADDSADVALVVAALKEEQSFGAACTKLAASHAALAAELNAVVATQSAHTDALTEILVEPPTSSTGAERPAGSVRSVTRRADALHDRRMADCRAAQAGALAQLFASMAASHAVTARYWRAG